MPLFTVDFTLPLRIVVDCDDDTDARRFVEDIGQEQIINWLCRVGQIERSREIVVASVRSISFGTPTSDVTSYPLSESEEAQAEHA